MQLINNNTINILAGNKKIRSNINKIFDDNICDFLSTLSEKILKNKQSSRYVDLATFAFWLRKNNLKKIKDKYETNEIRLGHGLVFHIAPANIALNFAYSFAYSLLAGNSNIVRVPSIEFAQNHIFFNILNQIFKIKKFNQVKESNLFISYDRNDEITKNLSLKCDYRVIWGSDKTVQKIKNLSTQPSCKELIFPDRYSISLINVDHLSKIKDNDLKTLTKKFYLDTLLFDQNACSSPHLILWFGKKNTEAYQKFWKYFNMSIKSGKYFNINEKNKIDKYTKFCELAAKRTEIKRSINGDYVSRMILNKIPKDVHDLRVGFGFFFEYFIKDLKQITNNINSKIQTLTYFGFKQSELKKFIYNQKPNGIDRLVPIGRALEFSEIWDGYDLIRNLSRIIDLK